MFFLRHIFLKYLLKIIFLYISIDICKDVYNYVEMDLLLPMDLFWYGFKIIRFEAASKID